MIDYACIFTTGGAVLWSKAFCDTQYKLDVVNLFVKNVLLDEKTALQGAGGGPSAASSVQRQTSYSFQDNVLRWKIMLESEFKIVFAIVYKQILHLTMIDDLLEKLIYDFQNKVWPKLVRQQGVIMTLPQQYEQRFSQIMIQWEKQKQEQADNASTAAGGKPKHGMKTFAETNRSKKSLKKEQKKLAMMEAGGGENGASGDEKGNGGEGSPAETTPTTAKERLQLKLRNSSKKSSGNS